MKYQFRYKNIYFEQQEEKYLGKQIFIGYWNYRPVCEIKWTTSCKYQQPDSTVARWEFYGCNQCIDSDQLQDIVDFLVFLSKQEE